ncbi:hypothetical protein LSAT2_004980 [Lamellibrachia satsuma]|nr:hypothetical protein LSAT2_004980 [Lamellibrachia satsuma]
MSTYRRNHRDIKSTPSQSLPLNVELDSPDASEMPVAPPKTPARQPHVSGADHTEWSDVSAEPAESTKAHTPEKSDSTPTLKASAKAKYQTSKL